VKLILVKIIDDKDRIQILISRYKGDVGYHELFNVDVKSGTSKWDILSLIADDPGITKNELINITGIPDEFLTNHLLYLEKGGLVKREK